MKVKITLFCLVAFLTQVQAIFPSRPEKFDGQYKGNPLPISNGIQISTFDCNTTTGDIDGLPHYLEVFEKEPDVRDIGQFLLSTSGTISYYFSDDYADDT